MFQIYANWRYYWLRANVEEGNYRRALKLSRRKNVCHPLLFMVSEADALYGLKRNEEAFKAYTAAISSIKASRLYNDTDRKYLISYCEFWKKNIECKSEVKHFRDWKDVARKINSNREATSKYIRAYMRLYPDSQLCE